MGKPALGFAAAAAVAAALMAPGALRADALLDEAVGFAGVFAFLGSGAPGLVIAAVRDGETAFAGFGETVKGSGKAPDGDTMMRIGSISKAFCGDVLGSLAADGAIALTDPLAEHLGPEFTVPEKDGRALRLIDLVTQASGLPREVPNQTGGTAGRSRSPATPSSCRSTELQDATPTSSPPGTGALYSNWGYDLLGLALANAGGKPYAELLAERVLAPRGLTDTKFNLRARRRGPDDAGPLLRRHADALVPSPETIECAGGLYTTANDMLKWMAWHLDRDDAADADWRAIDHAGWLWRDGLAPVSGIDDGGADGGDDARLGGRAARGRHSR